MSGTCLVMSCQVFLLSTFSLSHKQSTSSARKIEKNRQARSRTSNNARAIMNLPENYDMEIAKESTSSL